MNDPGLLLFHVGGWAVTSRGLLRLHDARLILPDELRRQLKETTIVALLGDPAIDPDSTVAAIASACAVHEIRMWRNQLGVLLQHAALESAQRQEQREAELLEALGGAETGGPPPS